MGEQGFTAHETRVLNWVLDRIIPPGPRPGAGEIGLADSIEETLRPTPEMGLMVQRAVAALDDAARARGAADFLALAADDREAVMGQVEASGDAFPPVLMLQTFSAYYQHPRILGILGLEARPPHPLGYDMPPNDLSLLEPVRRRGRIYREV